jgi:hypothetical protein
MSKERGKGERYWSTDLGLPLCGGEKETQPDHGDPGYSGHQPGPGGVHRPRIQQPVRGKNRDHIDQRVQCDTDAAHQYQLRHQRLARRDKLRQKGEKEERGFDIQRRWQPGVGTKAPPNPQLSAGLSLTLKPPGSICGETG